ncbi:MAG: TadE/TadG family type IV pilus assembly protein [Xanthobacteraceae bacterium]
MIRRLLEVARDCAGAAFLEFALVLPVLLLVAFGITQFGLIFYHYTLGTNAAAAGTRQLSISFQDPHPYCDTINAMINAILGTTGSPGSCPTIPSDFTITLAVDGTPCASDSACTSLLTTAHNSPPQPASVTVQFSCRAMDLIAVPGFPIHLGVCPLTSTIQAVVE